MERFVTIHQKSFFSADIINVAVVEHGRYKSKTPLQAAGYQY